jgi:cation transport ATPase
MSDAEKEINRKTKLFLGSFGLATAGSFIYAPLSVLCLPAALYILKDVYKGSLTSLFKNKELTIDTLVALLITLFIAKGFYLLCNLYLMLFLLNRKLLFKLKDNLIDN